MHGGKDKKLTVFTKGMQPKKPGLEIETNLDSDPMLKTHPHATTALHSQEGNVKTFSALTSPTNPKIGQHINTEVHDSEAVTLKKPMQKKTSQKDQPTPNPKLQNPNKIPANFQTNGFVSPKAVLNKDKVLLSYTSEKNLASGLRYEKKETPQRDSKVTRIEELEKIVQESKIRQSELSSKETQLGSELVKLKTENQELLAENGQLKKKIEKYKVSNEETKKMLKQRIHSYNEESGEMIALKNQIKTLEERVHTLLQENQALKAEINKFSDFNLKDLSNLQGMGSSALAVSNVREVHLQGSRVSQLYLKESTERDLLQFTNFQNMEENLDLESYISEAEESYLEEYKTNVDIFDKIKQEYEHIVEDIEIRYRTMAGEYQKIAKQQAAEIYQLQNKIDDLLFQQKQGKCQPLTLSLSLDELLLRSQKQISGLNLSIFDLRDSNKELLEDLANHRAQCRFLQAQLDIQRMKKKFKNENDRFEYNVVKYNLLNIIDKLKMQIDKEKARFSKIYQRYKMDRKEGVDRK